jgi:hypothetical protein
MAFLALMLTTAALLLRPGELNPVIEQFYPYEMSILLTIIFAFHTIIPQFEVKDLAHSPITLTFWLYYFWNLMSHVGNNQFDGVSDLGVELFKMMLYYFLVVGVLIDKKRFIEYLRWTTIVAGGCMGLALLRYWKYIVIPGIENVYEDGPDGTLIERMGGTGLLGDPNDLASIAATFMIPAAFFALRKGTPFIVRLFWLWLITFFFQAIQATLSRGGLVALGAGVVGYGFTKFGKKGLYVLPLLPVGLMLVGGRQGDMSLSSGTGQERIRLQHQGYAYYLSHPLFGCGPNHYGQEITGRHVAHNSFVQVYAETGFIGGAAFASAYGLALLMLAKIGSKQHPLVDPDLAEVRPFLVGMLTCQMAAKMSLSQTLWIPTFLIWAVMTAYSRIAVTVPPIEKWTKQPIYLWWCVFGFMGTVFFYFYLNAMVRF